MEKNLPIKTVQAPGGTLCGDIFVVHYGGGAPEYSVEVYFWIKPGPRSRPRKEHIVPAQKLEEYNSILNLAYTWIDKNPLRIVSGVIHLPAS